MYWLLLLVPTLAVGVGALVLLHREQARLRERTTAADAVARAAVEARAAIVAESAALLVADIQASALAGLRDLPENDLGPALEAFERVHPFVSTAFLCRADGTLLRPRDAAYGRRFDRLLTIERPWGADAGAMPSAAPLEDLPEVQKRVLSNLSQRQAVEDEVRKATAAAQSSRLGERSPSRDAAPSVSAYGVRSEEVAAAAPAPAPGRSGWVPWYADNALHVLGWLQRADGGLVRGVELDLAALVERLRGVLPADPGPRERYVIRDDRGAVLHAAGAGDSGSDLNPVVRLEFAGVLPNWEVVAWSLPDAAGAGAGGAGWFVLAALLVGVFVIAILSGGLLLLAQARRSEAEAALKTSFVANVSHEFKTPLTTIRLYAELLAEGRVSEPSRRDDYLRTIGRETQRLARLVGNVLDFSRLEQGRKQYRLEPLDLAGFVDGVLDTQAPRVAEAGLRLERVRPEQPLMTTTDRDALEQILLNLLDNACKYAAAGGEVAVSVRPAPGGGAVVAVADRGPGVPPEHAEAIFEKFHRVDDTLTSDQGGAGLGLGIARQLARGLGGDLRYEPREGGGAAFVLTLP